VSSFHSLSLDTSGCVNLEPLRVNLNPQVGLWLHFCPVLFTLSTSTVHVITPLSAVRSYLNNHVASHQKACHWRALCICLVCIRICCRGVPRRLPITSCTHLEATFIQEQHRCFDYYYCIQHCGRHSSPFPFGGYI